MNRSAAGAVGTDIITFILPFITMTECPSCALDIEDDADVCPYCGYDRPLPAKGNQATAILFAALLILPLLWWVWRLL